MCADGGGGVVVSGIPGKYLDKLSHIRDNFPFGPTNHLYKVYLDFSTVTRFWLRFKVRLRVRHVVLLVMVQLGKASREYTSVLVCVKLLFLQGINWCNGLPSKRHLHANSTCEAA